MAESSSLNRSKFQDPLKREGKMWDTEDGEKDYEISPKEDRHCDPKLRAVVDAHIGPSAGLDERGTLALAFSLEILVTDRFRERKSHRL